ncbi:MAG: hypothetical protein COC06_11610, partial [Bacteroidales bacterium]
HYKKLGAKNKALATVLSAKNDKLRWNYATWQMKMNLIYDMRKGLNDWLDDFTDEERGDAVLTVLESSIKLSSFSFHSLVNLIITSLTYCLNKYSSSKSSLVFIFNEIDKI